MPVGTPASSSIARCVRPRDPSRASTAIPASARALRRAVFFAMRRGYRNHCTCCSLTDNHFICSCQET
ncbi:Uncharacterised protein [Mycobacteroides abscessus]|nr:Uncharacterised protein [Mycobacteroides abscessus]